MKFEYCGFDGLFISGVNIVIEYPAGEWVYVSQLTSPQLELTLACSSPATLCEMNARSLRRINQQSLKLVIQSTESRFLFMSLALHRPALNGVIMCFVSKSRGTEFQGAFILLFVTRHL